jgi:hypothetical protein
VKPEALKKAIDKNDKESSFSKNGLTYIYGILPKKLSNTKLETMSIDACFRFSGIFSP